MAAPAAVLAILVEANTRTAEASLARTQGAMKATASSAQASAAASAAAWNKAGKKMAATGRMLTTRVGLPAAAAGGLMVKASVDFNEQMKMIHTQAGATQGEVRKMTQAILDYAASGESQSGPRELAESLFHIESQGFRGAEAMMVLKAAEQEASVGGSDMETTAKTLGSAMNALQKEGKDAAEVVSQFNTIVGGGDMRLEELSSALATGVLPAAQNFGLGLQDVGGALDVMTAKGMPATRAATALKQGFTKLAAPTDAARDALKEMGVDADELSDTLSKKGIAPAIDLLNRRIKQSGLSSVEAGRLMSKAFGGARTGTGLMLLAQNAEDLREKVKNAKPDIEKFGGAVEEQMETPAAKFAAEWAKAEATFVTVGEKLVPIAVEIAQTLGDIGSAFAKMPDFARKLLIGGIVVGPIVRMAGAFLQIAGAMKTIAATGALSSLAQFGGAAGGAAGTTGGVVPVGKMGGLKNIGKAGLKLGGIGALISGGISGVTGDVGSSGQIGGRLQNFGSGLSFGLLPSVADDQAQAMEAYGDTVAAFRDKLGSATGKSEQFRSAIAEQRDILDEWGEKFGLTADQVAQLKGELDAVAAESKLDEQVAAQQKRVRSEFEKSEGSVKKMRQTWKSNYSEAVANFGKGSDETKQVVASMRTAVAGNIGKMISRGKIELAEGKKHLAKFGLSLKDLPPKYRSVETAARRHFSGATSAAERQAKKMKTGVVGTVHNMVKEAGVGLGIFESNTNDALNALNVKPLDFGTTKQRKLFAGAGKQRGGIIGGSGDGDTVPVMAEPGEGFINKTAVKALGGKGAIDAINAAFPRFQKGGIVGLGRQLQKQGYHVSEHPAFGGVLGRHAPNSHHYSGRAIDVNADDWPGGEMAALDKLHARLKNMPGVIELLWRVADHFDHLHVAMSGGATGRLLGGLAQLPRVLLTGRDGPLKDMGQASLDLVRRSAQKFINERSHVEGAESIPGVAGGGSGRALMKAISRARGWNFADWWALDAAETSHGANLSNPNSTARLRGQFLDFNWGKYGPGSDPRQNPTMEQQIRSMAMYIAERYGDPSAAWRHHQAHNWYQRGGYVGSFASGGEVPRTGFARVHKGERISNGSDRVELHLHGGLDEIVDEVYAIVDGERVEVELASSEAHRKRAALPGQAGRR